VKVGDLVRFDWPQVGKVRMGIIVGFDEDDDPKIRDSASGVIIAHWAMKVKVISESR